MKTVFPICLKKRGLCNFHLGNLDLSLKDLTSAQLLEPNNPYRYASRAYVKNALKDVDGAIEDYEKAVHLDPEDAIAHNNLGLLQDKKGYAKHSKKSFEIADDLAEKQNLFNETEPQKEDVNVTPRNDEAETETTWKTIKKVFVSKEGKREFISFIKNGFRIKKVKSFLTSVVEEIADKNSNNSLVIFPTRRAASLYKNLLFSREKKAIKLPQIMTWSEYVDQLIPHQIISRELALVQLFKSYCKIKNASTEFSQFLNWGDTVLSDFEKVKLHGLNGVEFLIKSIFLRFLKNGN